MRPIKFKPILKQTLWGGEKLVSFKHLDTDATQIGESWEISAVPGSESVVAEGELRGKTLRTLIEEMRGQLVGEANFRRFGTTFPLLIKFIDARQDLSIQVHPSEEIARRQGKDHGKTEMWYIMESDAGAKLYCGLKQKITPQQYEHMVEDGTIMQAVADYEVKEGDCFFIPAGRIHSIGAGCFLAEIQQTSDLTYRIYDFKRKDKDGRYRELHTREAAACINFRVENNYRTEYVPAENQGVNLIHCPFFHTEVYDLSAPMTLDYSQLDSFVALVCLKGQATVTDDEGTRTPIASGETILIPATTRTLYVEGRVKFLATYV